MSASASSQDKAARLPRIVNTVLIAAIGLALAALSLKFLPHDDSPMAANATSLNVATSNGAPAPTATELARVIASIHLFGDASQQAKPVEKAPERVEPIKDTSLNLQLAGVFASDPAESAIAIISEGSGEQSAYGIGDKINGNTSLEAVYADHVILRHRGNLEKLSLPENVQPVAMTPVQNVTASPARSAQSQGSGQPVDLPTNPRELRDTLARNPSILGRVVAAEPYQENGKLVGYRITPKQNPEILEAQGIVAGDVITRVNNIQLNSQKQGIRALRNAVKAENLEVVILRDGIEVPVSISLAQ